MNRKGFTIVEMVMVVVIIGILAFIGAPYFINSLEKAKSADAKMGLNQIYRAELEYSADHGGDYTEDIENFMDVELNKRYWGFNVDASTPPYFTAIATRTGGGHSGETITMDQSGILSGNWEFLE